MRVLSNYVFMGLCSLIVVFSCGNNQKDNLQPAKKSIMNEIDTNTHCFKEISCDLIKNEKKLTSIVDSLEMISGKANYACRCFPDDENSDDKNKIVVQILKDDEFRLRGVAMFKYDTITNSFSYYKK